MRTTLEVPKKAHLSIKVDVEIKSELQKIAKLEDRSVHYVLIEAVERYISEKKEEEAYQEYVKNRVMKAYNRLITEGSNGVRSEDVHDIVMKKVKTRLAKNK